MQETNARHAKKRNQNLKLFAVTESVMKVKLARIVMMTAVHASQKHIVATEYVTAQKTAKPAQMTAVSVNNMMKHQNKKLKTKKYMMYHQKAICQALHFQFTNQ
jgi:hypothetical protein